MNQGHPKPAPRVERRWLERLHAKYHHRRFVHPDPLEFLYDYEGLADREIVGLVASSLAYGNVTTMLRTIRDVLSALAPRPARTLAGLSASTLSRRYRGFRYRFTDDRVLVGLLLGARSVAAEHGSLGAVFAQFAGDDDDTALPALGGFVDAVTEASPVPLTHLLPHPARGSACKRLNLWLRWMVRSDAVDPGGWTWTQPRRLVMPLDTHVFRTAHARGWTARRTPDLAAACEITAFLRLVRPDDPLRYDFAITRPGIRKE